jgi:CheY-like chemotaxis protein
MGARILLVEDDEVLANLIQRNLSVRKHDVSLANNAHEALQALHSGSFDLILLDINLPDLTGWEMLRIAQQEGLLRPLPTCDDRYTLPVVVLSAVRISPRHLAEFHVLAYLPKPFPMDSLLRLAAEAAARSKQGTRHAPLAILHSTNTPLEEDWYA